MQTVQSSVNGVDPRTGKTLSGITAGSIEADRLDFVKDRISRGVYQGQGEFLIPIRDGKGEIIGYERSLDPEKLKMLRRSTHLGEMIGAWAGRQVEEQMAHGLNVELLNALKTSWDAGKKEGRTKEFVNLSAKDLEDATWKDSWRMIPIETKDAIKEIFGDEGFMVRRDMINNAVGYRGFTVGEFWTGESRMSQEARNTVSDISTLILGRNAYKYLKTAEKSWQMGVSDLSAAAGRAYDADDPAPRRTLPTREGRVPMALAETNRPPRRATGGATRAAGLHAARRETGQWRGALLLR